MEANKENSDKTVIEQDYSANKENPGPAEEAVKEKNDKGVGYLMHWIIVIAIVLLAIAYFIFM